MQLTQLRLASLSDNFSSFQVSFSLMSELPKLCTFNALELKYLSLSVGSFKDLMIFQIPPPKKRLFSHTKVALKSKYSSTQTNETVMKCCFRKPVIFSSNVLVTFHSHISLGTMVIPYQSHAGLLVQSTGTWETLSQASCSVEPRRRMPVIANTSPCTSSHVARQKELLAASISLQLPISRCAPRFFRAAALSFC